MAADKAGPRGPVVLVMAWETKCGPDVWFPVAFGRTPQDRERDALRRVAAHMAKVGRDAPPLRTVCVQERGRWVPA